MIMTFCTLILGLTVLVFRDRMLSPINSTGISVKLVAYPVADDVDVRSSQFVMPSRDRQLAGLAEQ